MFDGVCGVLYGHGGVDAVDYAGGGDGDFDAGFLVCGAKNCGVAADIDGGSVDADAKPDVCDGTGVAAVVRVVYGDYDAGAGADSVLLRGAEAGVCGRDGPDDGGGDFDDIANYIVLFRGGVFDIGGGEFADFADFVGGDGAHVYDRGACGGAFDGGGGGVVREDGAGFPYCGGGVVWRDAAVFGGDYSVSGVGVVDLCGGGGAGGDEGFVGKV